MNWFFPGSIILSAVTGTAVAAAVITDRLSVPVSRSSSSFRVFLLALALTHGAGFLFYTFYSREEFRIFLSGSSPAAGVITFALLVLQYTVFILSAFLVPGMLPGLSRGDTRRDPIRCLLLAGAVAAAVAGTVILVLRAVPVLPVGMVLLADNVLVIPLVYGVWIVSLLRADRGQRALKLFLALLIPAGLLERAAVDPLWPVPAGVRIILGIIPFSMSAVLIFSVFVTLSRFRLMRAASAGSTAGPDFSSYALSPREEEIARLLLKGWANKEIAASLGISYGTVKNHIYALYGKLGIKSRYELHKKP